MQDTGNGTFFISSISGHNSTPPSGSASDGCWALVSQMLWPCLWWIIPVRWLLLSLRSCNHFPWSFHSTRHHHLVRHKCRVSLRPWSQLSGVPLLAIGQQEGVAAQDFLDDLGSLVRRQALVHLRRPGAHFISSAELCFHLLLGPSLRCFLLGPSRCWLGIRLEGESHLPSQEPLKESRICLSIGVSPREFESHRRRHCSVLGRELVE